ncbi:MAG TPA: nickel insertion protein, partial [Polyangiales bacterium]|nr:nickel insertion protein [Polyangiales bacterium]
MSDHHHHGHPHTHPPREAVAQDPLREREPLKRGAGKGRLLYLDAGSGIAGDMFVAGLLDLGVPLRVIEQGLAGIDVGPYSLQVERVARSGIAATHFSVNVEGTQPSRNYSQIVQLLERSDSLTHEARALALRAFEILARAEAEVHACPIEQVHFHEVGAVDSIVDIASAAIAIDHLGAEIHCSPLPLGRG